MDMLQKILAFLKGKNIDALSDAEKQELAKLTEIKPEVSASQSQDKPADDSLKMISAMNAKIDELSKVIARQEEERKAMQLQIQEQAKKDLSAKIQAKIDEAVKQGKIAAKDEADIKKWKSAFEKDFDFAEYSLSKIDAKIKPESNGGNSRGAFHGDAKPAAREELVIAAKNAFKTDKD